jgi:hypothetical protein
LILLFEPWNLGDAIIAASVARFAPDRIILACNTLWHEPLLLASSGSLNLLPLNLPYVWRTGKKFFSLGDAASLKSKFSSIQLCNTEIISIRGDLRDLLAARRIFNGAKFSFTGWRPFLSRKLAVFDRPFASGALPIRNRYRAWAEATDIPFDVIENSYNAHPKKDDEAAVVIHVGAQWRSKQYPHVAELTELLTNAGRRVEILAGPDDPLPPGMLADAVQRPKWPELIDSLKNASHVISNDSGPMHLSAFLGSQTIALSRCSNILEWLPPGVTSLSSSSAPRGYRPISAYWSDQVLSDWPSPGEIMACLNHGDL